MDKDECYIALANAVVLQAVKDYRKALKYDSRGMERECARFFHSEWFKLLTKLDGQLLIQKLKAEVN